MDDMHDDDPQSPAVPEVKLATVENDEVVPISGNLLSVDGAVTPRLVTPGMLVQGLRHLQQRIPDFVQLSLQEQRSMIRAAFLDPEFVEKGVHAAGVWHHTKIITGRTGEELRQELDKTHEWDEVERELLALAKGISHMNLQMKHRLGEAILEIYSVLGIHLDRRPNPSHTYMRPYYDDMKRAYLRVARKKSRKRAKAEEGEKAKE